MTKKRSVGARKDLNPTVDENSFDQICGDGRARRGNAGADRRIGDGKVVESACRHRGAREEDAKEIWCARREDLARAARIRAAHVGQLIHGHTGSEAPIARKARQTSGCAKSLIAFRNNRRLQIWRTAFIAATVIFCFVVQ